ncbi:MAG: hypothetical protein HKN22_03085 [Bacteroidia bacterium]|nr:hypothetical protein [Bacteroidia bacterium]
MSGMLLCSCDKRNDIIPEVMVDIFLFTTQPAFSNLNAIGGWTYLNGGVRGIIVYRSTQLDFVAMDRNCTYDPSVSCATVHVESNNIAAADTCCGSRFQLLAGNVLNGPATRGLKLYNTSFDGSVLHIYN